MFFQITPPVFIFMKLNFFATGDIEENSEKPIKSYTLIYAHRPGMESIKSLANTWVESISIVLVNTVSTFYHCNILFCNHEQINMLIAYI